jgi:4-hydroxybenzoate polyprenyltransferase
MATLAQDPSGALSRWATYFRERFPPAQYAVALGAFTWATLAYTQAIHGKSGLPGAYSFLVAFAVTFLLFLQLRILDEFKDYREDAQYRPYRPVPRGLVTLKSLARLWVIGAAIQLVLAASLGTRPIAMLLLILAYSGLMRVEFFVRDWLKAHALVYMGSHMLIVPMIAAFIAACSSEAHTVAELAAFLGFSYLNFSVFELGRKIWAPHEERTGVETYSALWGLRRAVWAWLAAMWGAAALGLLAAQRAGIAVPYAAMAVVLATIAAVMAVRFFSDLSRAKGNTFRLASAVWLLGVHITFGAAIALGA